MAQLLRASLPVLVRITEHWVVGLRFVTLQLRSSAIRDLNDAGQVIRDHGGRDELDVVPRREVSICLCILQIIVGFIEAVFGMSGGHAGLEDAELCTHQGGVSQTFCGGREELLLKLREHIIF